MMQSGRLRLRRVWTLALAWATASVFFTAVVAVSDILGGHKSLPFLLYANAVHFAFWVLALPFLSKCAQCFPLNQGRRIPNVAVLLLVVAASAALVTISQWAVVYATFFPYRSSFPTFQSFLRSELARFLTLDILMGLLLVSALAGWRTYLVLQAERTRATDLERQLAVSRLDALRMQLHPHFLFNTLHTIAGLVTQEPSTARRMVIALGDLLRLTLKDTGGSTRSLAEELEFADLFLG